MLHIDFETRSEVDLKTHGAYLYAKHPSTEVILFSYAIGDAPVKRWREGEPIPQDLIDHIEADEPGSIAAWNAGFERLIFWYVLCPDYDIPEPALDTFYCVAAQSRLRGLPSALNDAAKAMGAPIAKDHRGPALIKMCCIPPFSKSKKIIDELAAYCDRDVEVERLICKALPPLNAEELEDYHVNEIINDRGLLIDVEAAKLALNRADDERREVNARISKFTGGEVTTGKQHGRIKEWLLPKLPEWGVAACTTFKKGEKKLTTGKDARAELMDRADELAPNVVEFLEILEAAGGGAVTKFKSMLSRADAEDHRLRGAYILAGGISTGRGSSKGAQMHNMYRGCVDDVEHAKAVLRNKKRSFSEVTMATDDSEPVFAASITQLLSSMLRPSIMAEPGSVLNYADWSSIEARFLSWLAIDYPGAKDRLDIFKSGGDIYVYAASGIYRIPRDDVDKSQRQVGKVSELALGFCGGAGALMSMARVYRVAIDDPDAIVKSWRRANPWALKFAKNLHKTALRAMRKPDRWWDCGRVAYKSERMHGMTYLICRMPSGRYLYYPDARLVEGKYGPAITAIKAAVRPKADAKDWVRHELWYGILAENITQGGCSDILKAKLCAAVDEGIDVLGHTHDEIICQDADLKLLEEIMIEPLSWTTGLPMACTIDTAERYGK